MKMTKKEQRTKEEIDFLVNLEKDIDYLSNNKVGDRTIVYALSDRENKMIKEFQKKR